MARLSSDCSRGTPAYGGGGRGCACTSACWPSWVGATITPTCVSTTLHTQLTHILRSRVRLLHVIMWHDATAPLQAAASPSHLEQLSTGPASATHRAWLHTHRDSPAQDSSPQRWRAGGSRALGSCWALAGPTATPTAHMHGIVPPHHSPCLPAYHGCSSRWHMGRCYAHKGVAWSWGGSQRVGGWNTVSMCRLLVCAGYH